MPTHAHAAADARSVFALLTPFLIGHCAARSDGMAVLKDGFVIAYPIGGQAA